MANGVPVKHFTRCPTCKTEVGAVHDGFSYHDPARIGPEHNRVWKTSVHKLHGARCPGSRLQVSPTAVLAAS